MGTFAKILETFKICQNALTLRAFFWVNLSNSFDLEEIAVMGGFEIVDFESVL